MSPGARILSQGDSITDGNRGRTRSRRPCMEPLKSRIAPTLASPVSVGSLDGSNGVSFSSTGQAGHDFSLLGNVNGDRDGAPANPDVQIGAVTVGRDWMASDLVAK